MVPLLNEKGKSLLFVVALMALMATGARAQSEEDRGSIQAIITQQLEAFQHSDAAAAFSLASPMIQHMFETPDNFITMVERGYPPVYRPRRSSFGSLETINGELIQKVILVGPDGQTYTALYTMEQQPDGVWKINGCRLLETVKVDA